MVTLYKIVSDGEDFSYFYSKRGRVMAEYTDDPIYYTDKNGAESELKRLKESDWDYQFSIKKEIQEHWINKDNIEIVEEEFEDA